MCQLGLVGPDFKWSVPNPAGWRIDRDHEQQYVCRTVAGETFWPLAQGSAREVTDTRLFGDT